jgi:hypothetical protein
MLPIYVTHLRYSPKVSKSFVPLHYRLALRGIFVSNCGYHYKSYAMYGFKNYFYLKQFVILISSRVVVFL